MTLDFLLFILPSTAASENVYKVAWGLIKPFFHASFSDFAAANASRSIISFPAFNFRLGTEWKLTMWEATIWKACFGILAIIGMILFLDSRAWRGNFEFE